MFFTGGVTGSTAGIMAACGVVEVETGFPCFTGEGSDSAKVTGLEGDD